MKRLTPEILKEMVLNEEQTFYSLADLDRGPDCVFIDGQLNLTKLAERINDFFMRAGTTVPRPSQEPS